MDEREIARRARNMAHDIVQDMKNCSLGPYDDGDDVGVDIEVAAAMSKITGKNSAEMRVIETAMRRKLKAAEVAKEKAIIRNGRAREARAALREQKADEGRGVESKAKTPTKMIKSTMGRAPFFDKALHTKKYPSYKGKYPLRDVINAGLFPRDDMGPEACTCDICGAEVVQFDGRTPLHMHLLRGSPECGFVRQEIYNGDMVAHHTAIRECYIAYVPTVTMVTPKARMATFVSPGEKPSARHNALINKGYFRRDEFLVCAGCGMAEKYSSVTRPGHPDCKMRLEFIMA